MMSLKRKDKYEQALGKMSNQICVEKNYLKKDFFNIIIRVNVNN